MVKLFYEHLISFEELAGELNEHELEEAEREKLMDSVYEIIEHRVFDVILTHLPQEFHQAFLEKVAKAPYDATILDFIKEKTRVDIEREINKAAKKSTALILKDIRSSRKQ